MLTFYDEMVLNNPQYDVDGTPDEEWLIRRAIDRYAEYNGVMSNTLEVFFVNDNKQLVTVDVGGTPRQGSCGAAAGRPCQVGENGVVPWTLGAKGIAVKSKAEADAFFMKVLGWNKVSATASATAFMGLGVSQEEISVVPIGLYTTTNFNFVPGQLYTLLNNDVTEIQDPGSGNWGWVDFNGEGTSAQTARAWLTCGFNPGVTQGTWPTWCPNYPNASGYGPTRHYRPIQNPSPPGNYDPESEPLFISSIVYGPGRDGWWLRGSSGGVNANCQDFERRISNGHPQEGTIVLFPLFDRQIAGGGTDTMYHVRVIVAFRLLPGDVQCRPSNPPTPTMVPPGSPTPTPGSGGGGGSRIKWFIQGRAVQIYSNSTSGRHGNLRSTNDHVVFLDN
jgi:hypothetical protein